MGRGKLLVFGGALLAGATSITLAAKGRTRQERPTQKRGTKPFHMALHNIAQTSMWRT